MFKLNQKGLSLVEVIIAMGIAVTASLATMKMSQTSIKTTNHTTSKFSLQQFKQNTMIRTLSNSDNCNANFLGKTSTGLLGGSFVHSNQIQTSTGIVVVNTVAPDNLIGDGEWRVLSMSLKPFSNPITTSNTVGSCNLSMEMERVKTAFGVSKQIIDIPINCTLDGVDGLITSCVAGGASSDIWTLLIDGPLPGYDTAQFLPSSGQGYVLIGVDPNSNATPEDFDAALNINIDGRPWLGGAPVPYLKGARIPTNNAIVWDEASLVESLDEDGSGDKCLKASIYDSGDTAVHNHLQVCKTETKISHGDKIATNTSENSFKLFEAHEILDPKSFTLGPFNLNTGISGFTVGDRNVNTASYTTSFGNRNLIYADFSSAFGENNMIWNSATHSLASGLQNVVTGSHSVAIGKENYATENNSIAIGESNKAKGLHSAVIGGRGGKALAIYATTLGGAFGRASGEYSTVLGGHVGQATDDYATAIGGKGGYATKPYATALGGIFNRAEGEASLASGKFSRAYGKFSIAMGHKSKAGKAGSTSDSDENTTFNPECYSNSGIARNYTRMDPDQSIGSWSPLCYVPTAFGATAIGFGADAKGSRSIALSTHERYSRALAEGTGSIAIGRSCYARGEGSLCMGLTNKAMNSTSSINPPTSVDTFEGSASVGRYSVAIGSEVQAFGDHSFLFGKNIESSGVHSTIIGGSGDGRYKYHVNDDIDAGGGNSLHLVGHDSSHLKSLKGNIIIRALGSSNNTTDDAPSLVDNDNEAYAKDTGNGQIDLQAGVINLKANKIEMGGGSTINFGGADVDHSTGMHLTTSDRRLKKEIVYPELKSDLEKILALKPASYIYKNDKKERKRLGLIAQEVNEVMPEIVSVNSEDNMLALNYMDLISPIISSIKSLYEKVVSLFERTDSLEEKMAQMEVRLNELEKENKELRRRQK
jgi:hypothetical protein